MRARHIDATVADLSSFCAGAMGLSLTLIAALGRVGFANRPVIAAVLRRWFVASVGPALQGSL